MNKQNCIILEQPGSNFSNNLLGPSNDVHVYHMDEEATKEEGSNIAVNLDYGNKQSKKLLCQFIVTRLFRIGLAAISVEVVLWIVSRNKYIEGTMKDTDATYDQANMLWWRFFGTLVVIEVIFTTFFICSNCLYRKHKKACEYENLSKNKYDDFSLGLNNTESNVNLQHNGNINQSNSI